MKSLNKERAFKCVWRIKGQQQVLERIQKKVDLRTEAESKTNAQLSGSRRHQGHMCLDKADFYSIIHLAMFTS